MSALSRLSIAKLLTVGLVGIIALLALLSILVTGTSARIRVLSRDAEERGAVMARLGRDLQAEALRLNMIFTGIAATQETEQYAAAEKSKRAFHELLEVVRGLAEGDTEQAARLEKISADFDALYEEGLAMTRAYLGGGHAAGNAHMALFDGGLARVNASLEPFVRQWDQNLAAQVHEIRQAAKHQLWLCLAVALLMGSVALIVGRRIRFEVTGRLDLCVEALEAMRRQAFDHRLPFSGKTEFGRIAQAYNASAEAMQRTIEEVRRAADREKDQAREMLRLESERAEAERARVEEKLRREAEEARREKHAREERDAAEREAMLRQREEAEERLRLESERVERERRAAEELESHVAKLLELVSTARDGDLRPWESNTGAESDSTIGKVEKGLRGLVDTLRAKITEISEAAGTLDVAASTVGNVSTSLQKVSDTTSGQAAAVSAASEQVSQNVASVATAADEMHATIREVSRNAAEATRVVSEAVELISRAGATVGKLGERGSEIGQVVQLITSIAEQTNLLALNATIEAARAGESGKGFAVVATEVKDLANQTAQATEEITRKISAIQHETQETVGAIGGIKEIIGKVESYQASIAAAVEEQAVTSDEIARNVSEASAGVTEISSSVAEVARAASASSSGADKALDSAKTMQQMSRRLHELVAEFRCGG